MQTQCCGACLAFSPGSKAMRFGRDNLGIFTKIKMCVPFNLKTPLLGSFPMNKSEDTHGGHFSTARSRKIQTRKQFWERCPSVGATLNQLQFCPEMEYSEGVTYCQRDPQVILRGRPDALVSLSDKKPNAEQS